MKKKLLRAKHRVKLLLKVVMLDVKSQAGPHQRSIKHTLVGSTVNSDNYLDIFLSVKKRRQGMSRLWGGMIQNSIGRPRAIFTIIGLRGALLSSRRQFQPPMPHVKMPVGVNSHHAPLRALT